MFELSGVEPAKQRRRRVIARTQNKTGFQIETALLDRLSLVLPAAGTKLLRRTRFARCLTSVRNDRASIQTPDLIST